MRKFFYLVLVIVIFAVGALLSDQVYHYALVVNNYLKLKTNAPVYFRSTSNYINSPTTGEIGMTINSVSTAFKAIKLSKGTVGTDYDSLLIILDISNSTGGTADYDTVWIPIVNQ